MMTQPALTSEQHAEYLGSNPKSNALSDILVSIVIPVYNVEKYLRECLDSVISQTCTDIEVICVNDGSTDDSLKILKEYEKKDSRIQIVDQQNAGPGKARNAGLALAKGRYVYFIDSDDTIDADLCRMAFISAEFHGADILFFDLIAYDDRCGLDRIKACPPLHIVLEEKSESGNRIKMFSYAWSPMKFFRTDFLRENQLVYPTFIFQGEDMLFHWKVLLTAKKIGVLPIHLYYYRNRPLSLMQTRKVTHSYVFSLYDELKKELMRQDVYETYKAEYITQKLYDYFYGGFIQVHPNMRANTKQLMLDSLTEEEWEYVSNPQNKMEFFRRDFYRSLRGSIIAKIKFNVWWWLMRVPREFLYRCGVGVWYHKFRYIFAKRFSLQYVEQHRLLCKYVVELQKEMLAKRENLS